MNTKESIIEFCREIGLDSIGFSECRIFKELKPYFEKRKTLELENEFEESDIENRINPFLYMPEGKTIISIAFPYMEDFHFSKGTHFSKYTLGKDYHSIIKEYMEKICAFIHDLGYKAMYLVDNNSLPERYIAWNSGVGFIGKNNTLITEKYGSYVFLGEIITDLMIEGDKILEQKCGNCEICLNVCPTNSIVLGKEGINNNANICLSYITQKKEIEDDWFDKLNGRIFGCDTCQRACPYNRKIEVSSIKEFKSYEHMKEIDLDEIINMDNRIFKEKYKITSCGWRGKNIIKRNAIINVISMRKNTITDIEEDASPYIRDYYYRLLKFFKL